MAENGIVMNCNAAGVADSGVCAVLVVTTDEERIDFRSDVFEYDNFLQGGGRIVFNVDDWVNWMWLSPSGKYFLGEMLGRCHTNVSGRFVRSRRLAKKLFKIWGLHDRAAYMVGSEGACFRFDGRDWLDMSAGVPNNLHAIGGTAEDNLFCAGDDGFVEPHFGTAATGRRSKSQ